MKQGIKIIADRNKLQIRIINQAQIGDNFGYNGQWATRRWATYPGRTKLILESSNFPEYNWPTIYVRGSDSSRNNLPIMFPTEDAFDEAIMAINEFNEYFGMPEYDEAHMDIRINKDVFRID